MSTTDFNITPPKDWWGGLTLSGALALLAYLLAWVPGLKMLGALCLALLLGMLWRGKSGWLPADPSGIKFSSKQLLRWGIVLMGVRLHISQFVAAGSQVLGLTLGLVTLNLFFVLWLARRLGLTPELGALLAVGSSICGASAVAATAQVTQAKEDEAALALALMGLLGTAGVLLYVLLEPWLGLSPQGMGVLSGATLHEVAQVMAAAFTWGTASGEMGTMVKLTRVVMLAPVLLGVGLFFKKHQGALFSWKEPPIPYFVLGFLTLAGINSTGLIQPFWQNLLTQTSLFLMTVAMAAQGLNTQWSQIRQQGKTALLVGSGGFSVMVISAYLLMWLMHLQ